MLHRTAHGYHGAARGSRMVEDSPKAKKSRSPEDERKLLELLSRYRIFVDSIACIPRRRYPLDSRCIRTRHDAHPIEVKARNVVIFTDTKCCLLATFDFPLTYPR